jgi:transposase InsO family protein
VLGRGEGTVQRALNEVAGVLPFRLRGVDSEFINWHLKRWCEQKEIQLTRGRPYKKDDNAHIEQKNWTHVRKLLGWERYDTHEAVEAINDLYRHELRLWLNLFLPSVKLLKKVRVGSKVRRVYDGPRTPWERVRACPQADREQVAGLEEHRKHLDPFQLARMIDRKLGRIYRPANRRLSPQESETVSSRRGKGCGKDARSASLEITNRFPLSHSHGGDSESPVTFQMSRRSLLGLHSQMA